MSRFGRDIEAIEADIEQAKRLASTFTDWDVIDAMRVIRRQRA